MFREILGPRITGSKGTVAEFFWPSLSRIDVAVRDRSGSRRRPYWLLAALVGLSILGVTVGLLFPFSGKIADRLSDRLEGPWKEEAGARVIHIEPERIVEFDGQGLVVLGIVSRQGGRLVLRRSGLKENWHASVQGAMLQLEHEGISSKFRRLSRPPAQLELSPYPVASSQEIPSQKIKAICKEIETRFKEEQLILRDTTRQREIATTRHENSIYLRHLLLTVGWIDPSRYGARISFYTLIIAKHTEDLRLMMTLLPYANEAFKKSGKAQAYAILYDAVQLDLGRKQRYGTQVMEDERGPFLLPLEDPKNVDQYLADLGLPPLDFYLKQVEVNLYNGQTVRRNSEDTQGYYPVSLARQSTP